jgi:hypothetical protein
MVAMTGCSELQEECQYLPAHRLGEASAELACTLVAPYFSSGTSGFADAGSARRAGWRMSQFGNELAYLLRDPGRRCQSRQSRRADAEMLAMVAPDDSRLSRLASRTAAADLRYGARLPPYLHRLGPQASGSE